MSQINRIIESLVPLEKIVSPWDDQRWVLAAPTPEEIAAAPDEVLYYRNNWQRFWPEYPDQGNRGTCVGWGHTGDAEINQTWRDNDRDDLSPEDCYNKARKYDGLPDMIEGSNNLGALKARSKEGICLEETWPTSTEKNNPSPGLQKPEDVYIEESCNHVIDNYYQVPLLPYSWKTSIAGVISDPQWDGPKPVVAAYKVTQTMIDYASEHDGIMPPDPGYDVRGGHCSLFTDYKVIDGVLHYGNPNSWGLDWGDDGWNWFPQQYIQNGIIIEGFISHYGAPIQPEDPSDCVIARAYIWPYNVLNSARGGKTRLKAVVPRR